MTNLLKTSEDVLCFEVSSRALLVMFLGTGTKVFRSPLYFQTKRKFKIEAINSHDDTRVEKTCYRIYQITPFYHHQSTIRAKEKLLVFKNDFSTVQMDGQ